MFIVPQNKHAFRLNNLNMKFYGLNYQEQILGAASRDRTYHLRDDEAKPIDMSHHENLHLTDLDNTLNQSTQIGFRPV